MPIALVPPPLDAQRGMEPQASASSDDAENAPAEVYLQIGDFYFGSGAIRVRTVLGSCISITMWHPTLRVGGMCHYLLPQRTIAGSTMVAQQGLYADEAIELFLDNIRHEGTHPRDYIVKLFGGGNMFPQQTQRRCQDEISLLRIPAGAGTAEQCSGCRSVPCRNVLSARQLLSQHGFQTPREHVGGIGSRQLVFDLANGNAWVRHNLHLDAGLPPA
jgi:chemotaxis protein CheD